MVAEDDLEAVPELGGGGLLGYGLDLVAVREDGEEGVKGLEEEAGEPEGEELDEDGAEEFDRLRRVGNHEGLPCRLDAQSR